MLKIRRFVCGLTAFCALAMTSVTAHASENRYLRIINRASSPVRYLYASNVDQEVWGRDLLGPLIFITTDHYVDANIDDGTGHCLFDLKAVLLDGREAVSRGVNVCTQETWTVNDGR